MNQPLNAAKADGKDLLIKSSATLPAICIKFDGDLDASNVAQERLSSTFGNSGQSTALGEKPVRIPFTIRKPLPGSVDSAKVASVEFGETR